MLLTPLNLDLADRLIPGHVTKIHADTTAGVRQHPVKTEIVVDFGILTPGFGFGTTNREGKTLEE
jgi:hypothetical protein